MAQTVMLQYVIGRLTSQKKTISLCRMHTNASPVIAANTTPKRRLSSATNNTPKLVLNDSTKLTVKFLKLIFKKKNFI